MGRHFLFLSLALAEAAQALPAPESFLSAQNITVAGILSFALVVVWRLNGRIAGDNTTLHRELIQFHKDRAIEAVASAVNYERVVNAHTEATKMLVEQMKSNNKLLEQVLHELDKKGS